MLLVSRDDSRAGGKLTFVFLVVEQLVRGNHVHEANDTAVLMVLGSASSSQHGDGTNSTIKASRLLKSNSGA
jgi:hypothetical protein